LRDLDKVNREETFVDWIDMMPFPLASILWAYHTSGNDFKKRYEHLLHFFEAYAQFLSTILLSAFKDDSETITEVAAALEEANFSIERSTFGAWVRIAEKLAKRGRTMMNTGAEEERSRCERAFATSNREALDLLFSSKVIGLLQKVNGHRNSWTGHGGIVSEKCSRDRHALLEGCLNTLREEFANAWASYVLIRPGTCSMTNGVFHYDGHKLTGTRTPFAKIEFRLGGPLEHGQLHLIEPGEARALCLLGLVKILESPAGEENACYFYNRTDRNGVRFVSYHFASNAELTRPAEEVDAVLQLLRPKASEH
jgi:hypothetical protein